MSDMRKVDASGEDAEDSINKWKCSTRLTNLKYLGEKAKEKKKIMTY